MYTNRLKVALGTMLSAVSIGSISSLVVACQTKESWDTTITINNGYINDGFLKQIDKEGKVISTGELSEKFLKLLGDRFNELKNKDEETKKYKDVKFQIKEDGNKKSYYSKLEKNDSNNDIYITNYSYYLNNVWNSKTKSLNKDLPFKLVSQAATLRFSWQSEDNTFYKDGKSSSDPLRQLAEKNNNEWLKFGEYPDWYAKEKEKNGTKLDFDGSKYTNFYKKDELTYVYRGAVLIAGKDDERKKIMEQWESKNWDEFVKNGIVFEKTSSAGGYKYQVALFARHFGKTIEEIRNDLEKNPKYEKYIIKGQSTSKQLGKKQTNSDVTPLIGFDDEGSYNWTRSKEGGEKFRPTNFVSSIKTEMAMNGNGKAVMAAASNSDTSTSSTPAASTETNGMKDKNGLVIRTLTMTNPAGYDVVLARKGLLDKQVKLISEALHSLSLTENTYGIYTGYNKLMPLSIDLFEKLVKLQVQAESKQDLVTNIDKIEKQK
ncbi:ABC transporter substrate-binding protein [Mycoplasma capricolum subsp. capripneumoniae]|uniref:ABC transporter substrate-binding protein n=1 Tax=Mycoplasma capricolum subsp. capripneumoniae 87001 TaxID=1124992 RepID=A0A9N7G905_MYCCC|nr:ABC transporter substrate-binding protein [Mycoplasma capricolum]AJK51770.1 ABC transporter substrate-binding protein [Mycoplasma capricolum subsp. capripneumoniae 87001]AOQ22381.1 ABC transporter substrate-binding protein [Mycoplasma capricolum subsp. capripneumoniae M1601]AQU77708.1 ABC transporter substrate-binding protein [Mycoplasma capricolum subsp. capripneumoniae]KEY84729.1 Alkylphosphonate ABC transporter, substrate-binding component [Mycoplasma capricolum subsp. capripneumoniae 991